MLNIEVVYASIDKQYLLPLQISHSLNVEQAIHQSGILKICPEIDLNRNKIGIFSKLVTLSQGLSDGDRIEIYRELLIDPKEARRAKAM